MTPARLAQLRAAYDRPPVSAFDGALLEAARGTADALARLAAAEHGPALRRALAVLAPCGDAAASGAADGTDGPWAGADDEHLLHAVLMAATAGARAVPADALAVLLLDEPPGPPAGA